jgi:hypothetical protein
MVGSPLWGGPRTGGEAIRIIEAARVYAGRRQVSTREVMAVCAGREPGHEPLHADAATFKATVCPAPQVGPGGGCPGHRRWETRGSEGRLPLDNQGIIRVKLLVSQHHDAREAEWIRRDQGETARSLKPLLVEGKPTAKSYCADGCRQRVIRRQKFASDACRKRAARRAA